MAVAVAPAAVAVVGVFDVVLAEGLFDTVVVEVVTGGALAAAQKLPYQVWSSVRSAGTGQTASQIPQGEFFNVCSRADWQKQELYVVWSVTRAAGGTQAAWACRRRGHDTAQAGKVAVPAVGTID